MIESEHTTPTEEELQAQYGDVLLEFSHTYHHDGHLLTTQKIQVRKLVTIPHTENQPDEYAIISILNEKGQRVVYIDSTWCYDISGQLMNITANDIISNYGRNPQVRDTVSRFNTGEGDAKYPIIPGVASAAVVGMTEQLQIPFMSPHISNRGGIVAQQFMITIPNWYGARVTSQFDQATNRYVVRPRVTQ